MRPPKYTLAAMEVLLIFPAALFMAALFLRNVQPPQYEPAHSAQQIVNWYAGSPRIGLSAFLVALPLTVLVTGCAYVCAGGVMTASYAQDARVLSQPCERTWRP